MRNKHVTISQSVLLIFVSTLLPAAAYAIPIYDTSKDIAGLRGRISKNEGYLTYHYVTKPYGEERTGWTDVRHPALDGTTNTSSGFDRSDFSVNVRSTTVVDKNGVAATPNARRDFDYANQIYAQAGISVLQTETARTAYATVDYPLSTGAEDDLVKMGSRSTNPLTVNNYYVQSYSDGSRGLTSPPTAFPGKDGIGVTNSAVNDTFAHELGHYLLDTYRSPGGSDHDPNGDNLMASGTNRILPRPCDAANPLCYRANAAIPPVTKSIGAPADPGRATGNLGATDHLNQTVQRPGGTPVNQIRALNESVYVTHKDNGLTNGDVADFDWVEDNWNLERAGGAADNHPTFDPMVWEIGPIAHSTHTDHQHDAWSELNRAAFKGPNFRVVDIVSQIGRYIDMDVDSVTKNWSERASALDYEVPKFSKDGVNWVDGILYRVFKDGWTDKSDAENYVSRWISPVEAKYARIVAADHDSYVDYDGNAQIDAILAARGPYRNGLNKTVFGTKKNPTVSYDAVTGKLSFSDGVINVLNRNGANDGVDEIYLFDSLLGATLSISDFSLISPFDDGFLFGDGAISLMRDGIALLTADIPFLLIDDLMKDDFGINMIGDLTNMIIDQTLSSLFLNDFMNDYLLSEVITSELFGLTNFDLASLIRGGLSFVNYDVALFGSHSVPEPAVWWLLLMGLFILARVNRQKRIPMKLSAPMPRG
jgi:hypothetical protein